MDQILKNPSTGRKLTPNGKLHRKLYKDGLVDVVPMRPFPTRKQKEPTDTETEADVVKKESVQKKVMMRAREIATTENISQKQAVSKAWAEYRNSKTI